MKKQILGTLLGLSIFSSTLLAEQTKHDKLFIKIEKVFSENEKKLKLPSGILKKLAYSQSILDNNLVTPISSGYKCIGIMQICTYSIEDNDFGIFKSVKEKDLYSLEKNIALGGTLLSECINRHGNVKDGVMCYDNTLTEHDVNIIIGRA